jgi:Crp-like helix-turn-helix domain
MTVEAARRASRLLDGLSPADRDLAGRILAGSSIIEVDGGVPHFQSAFAVGALLVVEDGFVVVRATSPPPARSVVTFEAGPGAILLPPRAEEVLMGLGKSRLTAISAEARDRLLTVPAIAQRVVEHLVHVVAQRQEAISNFAPTRHVERVRRKLLQLAGTYGHVVREGIRIDFPISHALLAEMIGSSRETVTRALDELQRGGFVVRVGSTYCLLGSVGENDRRDRPHGR